MRSRLPFEEAQLEYSAPPRPRPRPSQLPARAAVDAARDKAMASIGSKAEDRSPGFHERARAFVLGYLARYGPTPGEILTLRCRDAGIVPHDDRAFGPVYFTLSREGAIAKIGEVRRERGHGTAGGSIWALAVAAR